MSPFINYGQTDPVHLFLCYFQEKWQYILTQSVDPDQICCIFHFHAICHTLWWENDNSADPDQTAHYEQSDLDLH